MLLIEAAELVREPARDVAVPVPLADGDEPHVTVRDSVPHKFENSGDLDRAPVLLHRLLQTLRREVVILIVLENLK